MATYGRHRQGCKLCGRPTSSTRSPYCPSHHHRVTRYGDPRAIPLTRAELRPYRNRALRVIQANPDHEGIQLAVNELDVMLGEAHRLVATVTNPQARRRYEILRDLYDMGLRGEEALACIAAVFLMWDEEPRRFGNGRHVAVEFARSLYTSRQRRGHLHQGRQHTSLGVWLPLGEALRARYMAFFFALRDAQRAQEEAARDRAAKLSAPMRSPAAAPANEART